MKLLGRGAQASVFMCKIDGLDGRYADKCSVVVDNEILAKRCYLQL